MNKKIFAALIATLLLMTGCKAAETVETSVPASEPSQAETSAATATPTPTPTPTATPTPVDEIPSIEDMDFETLVVYVADGNLMTDEDVVDLYGGTDDASLPQTVEEYMESIIEESHEYYFATDDNEDNGILNIAEINDYGINGSGEFERSVQVKLVEVDPDKVADYTVGGKITICTGATSVEYYDENDELVKENVTSEEEWTIAAINGNYIFVAEETVGKKTNNAAPFEDEELQAAYEAFTALG